MVIMILSEKEVEVTSVWTPFTDPADCLVIAGYGSAMFENSCGESGGIGRGMLIKGTSPVNYYDLL